MVDWLRNISNILEKDYNARMDKKQIKQEEKDGCNTKIK